MTTFKMQKLVGLPRNLIMAPGAGAPLPLYTLAGFLNREDRKEFVRMLRRRHNVPRRLRDEMALIQYFGSPSVRFFHFWKSKKSFHPYVTGIGVDSTQYGLSLCHNLLVKYSPNAFLDYSLDEGEAALDALEAYGIPVRETVRLHSEGAEGKILIAFGGETRYLGYLAVWQDILSDIPYWESMSLQRRHEMVNATFALASTMLNPVFIEELVRLCPDSKDEIGHLLEEQLDPVVGFALDTLGASQEQDQQPDQPEMTMDTWESLTEELHDLAVGMKDGEPSQERVEELRLLLRRFDLLPKEQPLPIEDILARLGEVFDRYESGSDAEAFLPILSDIRLVSEHWHSLIVSAGEQDKRALFEDLAARRDQAVPHENEYLRLAGELTQAVVDCKTAEDAWARSAGAHRKLAREMLKSQEARRDCLDDERGEVVTRLLAALNYRGLPFEPEDIEIPEEGEEQPATAVPAAELAAGEPLPAEAPWEEEPRAAVKGPGQELLSPQDSTLEVVGADAQPDDEPELDSAPVVVEPPAGNEVTAPDRDLCVKAKADQPVVEPATDLTHKVVDQFWSLVATGEYGLAYHLAKAASADAGVPSVETAHLLVLGTELVYPQGSAAKALEDVVVTFEPEQDDHLSDDSALASNLLLVAATLCSGLLAPGTGANDLLKHNISLAAGWDKLHDLIRFVTESSHEMHGAFVGPDAFRQRKADKTMEVARSALRDEAEAWLNKQRHSKTSFQAATNIWRQWVSEPGCITQLLRPLALGTFETDAVWEDLLGALSDPNRVDDRVQAADRELRGKKFGGRIDYKALDQIQRNVSEAVAMVRRWFALHDQEAPSASYNAKCIRDLDQGIDSMKAAVATEVAAGRAHPSHAVRSAVACLDRELNRLYAIFDPDSSMSDERTASQCLGDDLLRLPRVHADTVDQENGNDLLLEAIMAYLPGSIECPEAALSKMAEGDFEAAERLIEVGRSRNLSRIHEVADRLGPKLSEARAAFQARLGEVRRGVENAFRGGLIVENERDPMVSTLTSLEDSIDEMRRFDVGDTILTGVSQQVDSLSVERIEEIQTRLANLGMAEDDARTSAIRDLIQRGDMLAAEEHIDHVARGEALPASNPDDQEGSSFTQFLGTLPPSISLQEVEESLRSGKAWQGHAFDNLEEAQRSDAQGLIVAWNAVKRLKQQPPQSDPKFDANVIGRLLAGLGFRDPVPSLNGHGSTRLDMNMKAQPLADHRVCPVPEYGSDARGAYRIIIVFPRSKELDATEITTPPRGASLATVVLFMGPMSVEGRRKLLRQNLQSRRSWIVVDELMMLHIALNPQNRLRTLFLSALPFTTTDPFRIRQSGSVPAECFYGRAMERDSIMSPTGVALVSGGRQLGKSALLKEIQRVLHDPAAHHLVHWVDLPGHNVGRSCRPEDLWTLVVRELHGYGVVNINWPDFKPNDAKHVAMVTENIRAWLDRYPDGRILLLLDEADEFLNEESTRDYPVTRVLKTLMERTNGRFKVVFTGLHNVMRSSRAPNNPLIHLKTVEIGPLYANGESRAAFQMVRRPFAALGYVFEDDSLIMSILAACNYYPILINLFCRKLLDKLRSRIDTSSDDPTRGPIKITKRLVADIQEDASLREEVRHYFQYSLDLDLRYEILANWLAGEYLQKRMDSAKGLAASEIRSAVTALWPEGFRGTAEHDFEALLMEMVGLAVLRLVNGGHYTFRNPNVLKLMGTASEISDRIQRIAVDGELKKGFDPAAYRSPVSNTSREPRRSPLTIEQESSLCDRTNRLAIVCGAQLSGLSEVPKSLEKLHEVSQLINCSALSEEQMLKDLEGLRGKAKTGINVMMISDTRPWTLEWVESIRGRLAHRTSMTTFVRPIVLVGSNQLWNIAKEGAFDRLDAHNPLLLKPWNDTFLWAWMEDMGLQPQKPLRKAILEATDGRTELIMQLHADFDAVPKLMERIVQFRESLMTPERAQSTLAGLGVLSDDARKGLRVFLDLPGTKLVDLDEFWAEIGPAHIPLKAFVRWAELLCLMRTLDDGWEVEPFVAALLAACKA